VCESESGAVWWREASEQRQPGPGLALSEQRQQQQQQEYEQEVRHAGWLINEACVVCRNGQVCGECTAAAAAAAAAAGV